ncbi:MAG TPA: amylo-alpha-1,6-glucosidase [Planctomycetota bacterium]|nr:amylo-alpha-1,6-glucosidase [Planctomycetota bacterium]
MNTLEALGADDREWLETDGLGGFASGRADLTRSRRYHALLVTAVRPPVERVALVQGVEAWLVLDGKRIPLCTNVYQGDVLHPDIRGSLRSFQHTPWPRWTFQLASNVIVTHEIFVPRGRSAVVLTWRLVSPHGGCRLEVRPLLSCRDPHALHHENPAFEFASVNVANSVRWHPYDGLPRVVALSDARYEQAPEWYRNFLYADERQRGFDHREDLASPGIFHFDLSSREAALVFGTESSLADVQDSKSSVRARVADWRRTELVRRERSSPLQRAAEAYVVARGKGSTIIAGYPWFGDWGRDTFIALRGLCLATGRTQEARAILLEWAKHVSAGMLPNRFPDAGGEPEYNSVDAALWFVVAVHELRATLARKGDRLAPADARALTIAVRAILDGHLQGTRHGIAADEDGLLRAGEPGVQLTWMDACVDGRVITPRTGKPVEIQALWLNALWIGQASDKRYRKAFEQGRSSFEKRFWNESLGFLYDVVDEGHVAGKVDDSLRPNQLLAIGGLPLRLLGMERARSVVDAVEQHLWTPLGPRSLDPRDPRYACRYEGGPRERDGVYHQGAVWPWLAGPFVEAWVRVRGCTNAARREAREKFLRPLLAHLERAGLGHVSEIADGEAPHTPRGAPFQAWSLGELIRLDAVVLALKKDDAAPCSAVACPESECSTTVRAARP